MHIVTLPKSSGMEKIFITATTLLSIPPVADDTLLSPQFHLSVSCTNPEFKLSHLHQSYATKKMLNSGEY